MSGSKAIKNTPRFFLIRLCIFLSGLSVFAQLYLFQPLLPQIASNFQTSIGNSSFLVSSSTIGMALGLFFFTFNADNYARKRVMVFSLLSSAVLTVLSVGITNLSLLVAIGIMKGFAVSGVSAVALAYIIEEIDTRYTGLAIGFYLSGNIIGGMTGRIVATLIAGEWGWRMAVLGIGIESLILGIIFWRYFPRSKFFHPTQKSVAKKLHQMKDFLRDHYLLLLYFIAALGMGVFVSVYNYISFRLENPPFDLHPYIIAFIFVMYLFGVVGTMLADPLTKRYGAVHVLETSILVMAAGILLLLSTALLWVILGIGLLTLGFFAIHTTASHLVAEHAKEGKSAATSIYWLFYYLGSSVLGSGTGYVLHDASWTTFVLVLIFAVFIAFLLILSVGRIMSGFELGKTIHG